MGLFRRASEYLRLTGAPGQQGYIAHNRAFPGVQSCERCGSLVLPVDQKRHSDWHASLAKTAEVRGFETHP